MFLKILQNKLVFTPILLTVVTLLFISGCANTSISHNTHHRILDTKISYPIKNVLLLPTEIRLYEYIAGNYREPVPKLSNKANQVITDSVLKFLDAGLGLQATYYDQKNLSKSLREHVALLHQVLNSIYQHANTDSFDVWPHKITHFDYSIGAGLAFLKAENIDAVLIMRGVQYVSVFRDNLEFDKLKTNTSLIDVNTGDIMWVDFSEYPDLNIREPQLINEMLVNIFKSFPHQELVLSSTPQKP